MFPLVARILSSNLLSLGRALPGRLISMVFRILGAFLILEPAHAESLYQSRNLIDILKFWLTKAGHRQMVTSELLSEV